MAFRASMPLLLALLVGCSGAQTSPPPEEPATVATVVVEPATTDLDAGPDVDSVALANMAILGAIADSGRGLANILGGPAIDDSDDLDGLGLFGIDGGAIGIGSLGRVGTGLGGGSAGSGAGLGTLGTRPRPDVATGNATQQGALDKDVIRRVIRRSLSRIRYCYERELLKDPNLAGRVSVRFVIRPDGTVTGVSDGGSSLPSEEAKACVRRAISALVFPRPKGGGVVTVTYPFIFAPGAGADAGAPAADAAATD